MASYKELSDRTAVEWAMEEFDRRGRDAFLHSYGYGEARDYFLVSDTGRYDTKAIFAAAYERQHGVAVSNDEISGGKNGAARRIAELGFDVEGIGDKAGRKTFATFDEALREFRIPLENLPAVREFLAGRIFTQFYIPKSGSYIAALTEDGLAKAFIHSGYIWHSVARGVGEQIELPVNRIHGGGYRRDAKREPTRAVCPVHFIELPATGICPDC